MRICSPQLGISPRSILGGEIYDRELLRRFARYGVEVEIILPAAKPHDAVPNWRITHIPIPFVVPPHLYNLYVLPYLIALYRSRPFDVLRVHSPAFTGVAGVILKKMYPRIQLVGTYHWLGEGGWFEGLFNPLFLRACDLVFCDSEFTKQEVITRYPVATDKVAAVYNGVDESLKPLENKKKLKQKLGIDPSTTVLVYMGLFIPRKNPELLLSLLKRVRSSKRNVLLLLCGRGELERRLRQLIAEEGLEDIARIVSPVFGSAKNELFNAADVYVHPAKHEGFSLAVIEAMATGLPVVITRGFSASEAVANGKNGFLCANRGEWVEALQKLIDDPLLRRRMGSANTKRANEQFRWDVVAKQQLRLLSKLVTQQKK